MKDKRKDHGTENEPSLEQQFYKYVCRLLLLNHNTSATGSYSRLVGRQAGEIMLNLEIFNF